MLGYTANQQCDALTAGEQPEPPNPQPTWPPSLCQPANVAVS